MIVISKKEAKSQGLIRYFTGKPCSRGHIAERLVSNWMCVSCNLNYAKTRYKSNPSKAISKATLYNKLNVEKRKATLKKWKQNNQDQVYSNTAKRRAAKLNRTPFWLNDGQLFEMESVYKYCASLRAIGLDYEVDHIIPLQGKTVSGLHAPWNLQVITASENAAKGNRI